MLATQWLDNVRRLRTRQETQTENIRKAASLMADSIERDAGSILSVADVPHCRLKKCIPESGVS